VKRPHLLRVDEPPATFAPLLEAVAELGLRSGWLEWQTADSAPDSASEPAPRPPALAAAAGLGVLRAVAVGLGGSVAVKPRGGPPVAGDVLREHFLGCRLVLVRGAEGAAAGELAEAPRLLAVGEDRWRVEVPGQAALELTSEKLAQRLRRPRPWGEEEAAGS
jgi:hypothetical protein